MVAAGAHQLQKQPEAVRQSKGFRQALQHDPGERQGDVDRGENPSQECLLPFRCP